MSLRSKIMLALGVLILVGFNISIVQKERILRYGEPLLLELAPVDPRSLLQGDYMRLDYAVVSGIPREIFKGVENPRGYIVIRADENNVGQFVRIHNEATPLREGEKLLLFHRRYYRMYIFPNSFLFQEGHREFYQAARYGIFKFSTDGSALLVGLADENRVPIVVPE